MLGYSQSRFLFLNSYESIWYGKDKNHSHHSNYILLSSQLLIKICFAGCTISLKHRNCKFLTATLVQITHHRSALSLPSPFCLSFFSGSNVPNVDFSFTSIDDSLGVKCTCWLTQVNKILVLLICKVLLSL